MSGVVAAPRRVRAALFSEAETRVIARQIREYVVADVAASWGVSRPTITAAARGVDPADELVVIQGARLGKGAQREAAVSRAVPERPGRNRRFTDAEEAVIAGQARWYLQVDVASAWGVWTCNVRQIVDRVGDRAAHEWPEIPGGRPRVDVLVPDVLILDARGLGAEEIGAQLGLAGATVLRILVREGRRP